MGNQQTAEFRLREKEQQATNDLAMEHIENVEKISNETLAGKVYEPIDNSAFEYNYERLELPKDDEGYCISFSPDQEEEYLAFFKKYGVVVVNSLLTEPECKRSVDELWQFLGRTTSGAVKRNDPESWEHWPALKSEFFSFSGVTLFYLFRKKRSGNFRERYYPLSSILSQ